MNEDKPSSMGCRCRYIVVQKPLEEENTKFSSVPFVVLSEKGFRILLRIKVWRSVYTCHCVLVCVRRLTREVTLMRPGEERLSTTHVRSSSVDIFWKTVRRFRDFGTTPQTGGVSDTKILLCVSFNFQQKRNWVLLWSINWLRLNSISFVYVTRVLNGKRWWGNTWNM